jgi:hypothetical protein
MAALITVSVASMLNASRATAASAMLRVSQEENLRLRVLVGSGNILLAQIGGEREYPFGANWWVGTRNDCAQYFEIEIN